MLLGEFGSLLVGDLTPALDQQYSDYISHLFPTTTKTISELPLILAYSNQREMLMNDSRLVIS